MDFFWNVSAVCQKILFFSILWEQWGLFSSMKIFVELELCRKIFQKAVPEAQFSYYTSIFF